MVKMVQCNQPVPRKQLAGHPRKWCHIRSSALVSVAGRLSTLPDCSQISFGERKSVLLTSCIDSVPVPGATLVMSLLGDDRGGRGMRPPLHD